jgi:hypothetical protein
MNIFRFVVGLLVGILGLILLLPILLLISPWIIVSLLTTLFTKWFEPSYLPWNQIVEYDSHLGWRNKPNLKGYHLADDGVYQTTTDAEGWRGRTTLDESQVLVFGDSYAFGHAAPDRYFFGDLNPHLQIKAIGVSGYNMVQEFLCMRRLAPRMRGKLAVWFVYLGNDLTESLTTNIEGYRVPFLRKDRKTGEWEVFTSHLSPSQWSSGPRYQMSTFYQRYSKIFVPGLFAERVFSACEYLIGKANKVLREGGSRLVVAPIPSKEMLFKKDRQKLTRELPHISQFEVGYPNRKLREICSRLGVPFIAGSDYLNATHYRRHESHWNKKGHERVAELLADLYKKHAPVPLKGVTTDEAHDSNVSAPSESELLGATARGSTKHD